MELNIKDKKVLITGSSKGIGLGILSSFVKEGSLVVANSRNDNSLDYVSEKFGCHTVKADVSDSIQAKELIEKAIDLMGGLDILVCNVGGGSSVPPGQESRKEWGRVFDKNFFSTTNTVEAAWTYLKKSSGSIVCISSICGTNVIDQAPVTYGTAKAALNHYVRTISKTLAKDNVRINAIAAGNILFEGSSWEKKLHKDEHNVKKMIQQKVPLNIFGDVEDISNLVLYLSSPLSKFITGSIYTIDGGQSCN
tara:strand:+ start:7576 stop:8328 length:753 start_codon:yes stop_codon:yes gene_type:complete